jgi:rubrerythrin
MDRMDMDKKISRTDEKRYEGYLKAELEAAAVYSALADTEADPQRARIFNELVEAELRHASRWAGKLVSNARNYVPVK